MGEKIMQGFPSREEALADFFAAWEPPEAATATELVSLDEAIGRVTARDLVSANTLPVVRASACDGIAQCAFIFNEQKTHGMPSFSRVIYP